MTGNAAALQAKPENKNPDGTRPAWRRGREASGGCIQRPPFECPLLLRRRGSRANLSPPIKNMIIRQHARSIPAAVRTATLAIHPVVDALRLWLPSFRNRCLKVDDTGVQRVTGQLLKRATPNVIIPGQPLDCTVGVLRERHIGARTSSGPRIAEDRKDAEGFDRSPGPSSHRLRRPSLLRQANSLSRRLL